ncbi:MAG: mandelate racemase/muconate lactonizing enzyme family protein [Candidatus Hodarchaeota archaeon]
MKQVIESIELTPIFVPFKKKVLEMMQSGQGGLGMAIPAEEEWLGGDFVICRLILEDGTVGLGEAFVWLPETGVSTAQIIDIIEKGLCKYVLNENPFEIEKINQRMDNNVARNEVAKGLLDMACYDLMGKVEGKPACEIIGQHKVDTIPLAAMVPLSDLDTMKEVALVFKYMKYGTFRIKLGNTIEDDIEIMKELRNLLGPDANLRVDYNQAYNVKEAIKAINAIEEFNVDLAEQPVRSDDYLGMAQVQKNVNIPLMAHEGFFSLRDFFVLAELGAIGVLGMNSERPGGVTKALRALNHADKIGMKAVLHNQPLGIATAMHVHLNVAREQSFGYAAELFGDVMLEDDLITKPIKYRKGMAYLPKGDGWGVMLDMDAMEKYAKGETIIIK